MAPPPPPPFSGYIECNHGAEHFETFSHRWPEDPPGTYLKCMECPGTRPTSDEKGADGTVL